MTTRIYQGTNQARCDGRRREDLAGYLVQWYLVLRRPELYRLAFAVRRAAPVGHLVLGGVDQLG
jgi:hypothetical protein